MARGGLYSDFEAYRVPTIDKTQTALRDGILSLDTNVLLNLYRYNQQTVEDMLRVFNAARERLFVPHQVVREFWRNRQSVIGTSGSATKDIHSAFSKNSTSTQDAIRRWAKSVALPEEGRDELVAKVERFFGTLRESLLDEPSSILQSGFET